LTNFYVNFLLRFIIYHITIYYYYR